MPTWAPPPPPSAFPVYGKGGTTRIVTLLVYHNVASAVTFAADLDLFISWNYTTITPTQLAGAFAGTVTLPDKPLMITFDDGYATQFSNAYPELLSRGMTATFYVATGWLDGTLPDSLFSDLTAMSWANAVTMFANGMRIQSHSATHVDLSALTNAQILTEWTTSKARIVSQVPGETVTSLAYPYGAFDADVVSTLAAAGCLTARTVRIGPDGEYAGANLGRYAYASLLGDPRKLPVAGTAASDVGSTNFYHGLAWDEELIPDVGFEGGAQGWTLGVGFSSDTGEHQAGTKSLKCAQGTATVSSFTTRLIPVEAYGIVRGTVWIKTVGLTSGVTKVQLQTIKPDRTTILVTADVATVTGNNGAWAQTDFSYGLDGNVGYIRIYCSSTGNGAPTGNSWWDGLSLHRDTATAPMLLYPG